MESKYFYGRLKGDYALFTAPETKGGGEKITYMTPTCQALHGIVDACYFKPVFINIIDEVKIMNPIRTHTMGYRALYKDGSPGLNYVTMLENVEYLVKFHFTWNLDREDLKEDRNMKKHEAIMERSLKRGGRRDIFLGSREFIGYLEALTEEEYQSETSYYQGQKLSLGMVFHSFRYPNASGGKLKSYYTNLSMVDGIVTFPKQEECLVENTLSSYHFKYPRYQKSVEEEFNTL